MHVQAIPTERVIGRVRLNVAIGPIARMFEAEAWREPDNHGGGGVFAGRLGEVIENVEREPDPSNPSSGLFNLDAHIHDVDSGHPVPYLNVRADVSRGGVPVLPEVLLRLASSALTGTDVDCVVEFTLDFANATQ